MLMPTNNSGSESAGGEEPRPRRTLRSVASAASISSVTSTGSSGKEDGAHHSVHRHTRSASRPSSRTGSPYGRYEPRRLRADSATDEPWHDVAAHVPAALVLPDNLSPPLPPRRNDDSMVTDDSHDGHHYSSRPVDHQRHANSHASPHHSPRLAPSSSPQPSPHRHHSYLEKSSGRNNRGSPSPSSADEVSLHSTRSRRSSRNKLTTVAGRKLSQWKKRLPRMFHRQDAADGEGNADSSESPATDNNIDVDATASDSAASSSDTAPSSPVSSSRRASLQSMRASLSKNIAARISTSSLASGSPIKSPSRNVFNLTGGASSDFAAAVQHLKPLDRNSSQQLQPLAVPQSPSGNGPSTIGAKTITIHQSLSNLSCNLPADQTCSLREPVTPCDDPKSGSSTTSFSFGDSAKLPATALPSLIMPKSSRRQVPNDYFGLPLRHASTVDSPGRFGSANLFSREKSSSNFNRGGDGVRISSLFQSGSSKMDLARLKKTKSMDPSASFNSGRTSNFNNNNGRNDGSNKFPSLLGATGRSTTAPVHAGGFQQIPLQRFKTIEPESGAMKTSMSYRINRQQMFQEHLTIHAFDGHGKKMVKKLTGMGAVQQQQQQNSPLGGGHSGTLSRGNLLDIVQEDEVLESPSSGFSDSDSAMVDVMDDSEASANVHTAPVGSRIDRLRPPPTPHAVDRSSAGSSAGSIGASALVQLFQSNGSDSSSLDPPTQTVATG